MTVDLVAFEMHHVVRQKTIAVHVVVQKLGSRGCCRIGFKHLQMNALLIRFEFVAVVAIEQQPISPLRNRRTDWLVSGLAWTGEQAGQMENCT